MIASALVFLFGFFGAWLLALLVAPLVWRRAKRIALREYEATIPASANEIRAGSDHARAASAMEIRRRERASESVRERAARHMAQAGRMARETAATRERNRGLVERLSQYKADLQETTETLETREREYDALSEDHTEMRQELELRNEELDSLSQRFDDLGAIADERRASIDVLESKYETAADDLRGSERKGRERQQMIDRLGDEVEGLEAKLARETAQRRKLDERIVRLTALVADQEANAPAEALETDTEVPAEAVPSRSDARRARRGERAGRGRSGERTAARTAAAGRGRSAAEISLAERLDLPSDPLAATAGMETDALRDHLGDFAARIIHEVETREGDESTLGRIIGDTEGPSETGGTDRPSIAERVRRLRQQRMTRDQAAE